MEELKSNGGFSPGDTEWGEKSTVTTVRVYVLQSLFGTNGRYSSYKGQFWLITAAGHKLLSGVSALLPLLDCDRRRERKRKGAPVVHPLTIQSDFGDGVGFFKLLH